MGKFVLTRRACLHIPHTGPMHDHQRGHLHIVLTDVCEEGKHLLAPICTAHKRCDRTCLLGEGDHKFIVHLSYVAYSLARTYEAAVLIKRVSDGDISYRGLLDEALFGRICLGLMKSPMTPLNVKTYFGNN